jgi:UDP-N-acetylmuramoyl-tripeptide--D-alanyl-D-alanine ligase
MKSWTAEAVAAAAGATLAARPGEPDGAEAGPDAVVIDSRQAGPGALFVGLPGSRHDGGEFATAALAAGAWGVIVSAVAARPARSAGRGHLIVVEEPLRALQRLALSWRRALAENDPEFRVIGVTGSTGKTSTKDLLRTVLSPQRRTVASRANFNTEIGVPLEILAAPSDTQVLVLEMAMRGAGQIAELAAIAEPDVGIIVSIGPVHLELLGTMANVAAAKAELIAALAPGATAVLPAAEPLLEPHLRSDLRITTFGDEGEVHYLDQQDEDVVIATAGGSLELEVPFRQTHLRTDLLAAVAGAQAVGVTPYGRVDFTLSAGRGENVVVGGGVMIIDGCYNANPMSMRAALIDLAETAERNGAGRRVAVLGDMLELGPEAEEYHRRLGALVDAAGVDLLVTVGPLAATIADEFPGEVQLLADAGEAAAAVPELVQDGDVVLVKGSLGVGLKQVCDALTAGSRV